MRRAKEDEKQGKLPSKPFLALPWSLRVSPRKNISILFWLKNRTNGHCNKFLFWLVCTRVVCVCVKIRGCTYLSLWVWRLEVTSGIFFIFFYFFKRSPPYFLSQALSLNEELAILQDQLASEAPSSGVTDVSLDQTQIRSEGHSPDWAGFLPPM